MKKVLLVCIILIAQFTHSQAIDSSKIKNIRSIKKLGWGLQLLGPTGVGSIYVNFFATHNINLEVGGGLFGFYGGTKIFYGKKNQKQHATPFFGVSFGQFNAPIPIFGGQLTSGIINAPIGIQIMSENGFQFSIELSVLYFSEFKYTSPWGAIKIGKNF